MILIAGAKLAVTANEIGLGLFKTVTFHDPAKQMRSLSLIEEMILCDSCRREISRRRQPLL